MIQIEDLLNRYQQYRDDPMECDMIRKAYHLAETAHAGQRRKTNNLPFIIHPLSVAFSLADMELDWEVICSALLHDTIEDTHIRCEDLRTQFGDGVAGLVDALTKIKRAAIAQSRDKRQAQSETMRKIIIGATQDVRVILIKLADRWDNIKTLESLSPASGKKMAEETLAIYAPFADRLGLSIIRRDLEELSFKYLKPKQYSKHKERLSISRGLITADVSTLKSQLIDVLLKEGLIASISENYPSVYEIASRSKISQASPIVNLVVFMTQPRDCYMALGIIHEHFTPLPGSQIQDFIAIPRSNGYQAIHTSLLFHQKTFPIHIMTHDMLLVSKYGILALDPNLKNQGIQNWMGLLKDLLEDEPDSMSFLKGIKQIASEDQIYVCSPQGEVFGFPSSAIVLDFAYRIHTELGHHCVEARMDTEAVDRFDELKDGTVVTILTSPSVHPTSEWLMRVKTPRARAAIREWLEMQRKVRSRQIGRTILLNEMSRFNLNLDDIMERPDFKDVLTSLNSDDLDDFFSRIGRGILTPRRVIAHFISPDDFKRSISDQTAILPRLKKFFLLRNKRKSTAKEVLQITDIHDAFFKLSQCCNPLPGDDVLGIQSMRHGISIHKVDCAALKSRKWDEERTFVVKWALKETTRHPVRIVVRTDPDIAIADRILSTIIRRNMTINHFHYDRHGKDRVIEVELEISSVEQIDALIRLLESMKGVQRAHRV